MLIYFYTTTLSISNKRFDSFVRYFTRIYKVFIPNEAIKDIKFDCEVGL
jgi:hypothetical protein